MKPNIKRVAGIGCVVLLVAYGLFLVAYFKTMPARLAASNDIRSKIKWTLPVNPMYYTEFQISDAGKIYSAGYGGEITCFNQDGNLEWKSTAPKNSNVFWTVLRFDPLDDGSILALFDQPASSVTSPGMQMSTSLGNIEMRIIDSTGTTIKQQLLPTLTSVITVKATHDQFYVLGSSDIVYAFDLDGNLLWQYGQANPNAYFPSNVSYSWNQSPGWPLAILPESGLVVVQLNGNDLTILNTDGTLHAQTSIGMPNSYPHFQVGKHDEIYFAQVDLQAFDSDCKAIWQVPLNSPIATLAEIEIGNDGAIYVCLEANPGSYSEIICLNPGGTERWRSSVPGHCTMFAVARDGTVYATGRTTGLHSLDPQGKFNWSLNYAKFSVDFLNVTPDGTVLISDYNRTWALEP